MREIEDAIRSLERNKMLKKMTIEEITMGSWEPLSSDEPITDPVYLFLKSECAAYDLALSALREQAERGKGCEYCTTEEQQNERGRVFYKEFPHDARFLTTLDDAHLQVAFDNQSGWVLHFEDDRGDRMFDVKIASCPSCGKRLEAQHE